MVIITKSGSILNIFCEEYVYTKRSRSFKLQLVRLDIEVKDLQNTKKQGVQLYKYTYRDTIKRANIDFFCESPMYQVIADLPENRGRNL